MKKEVSWELSSENLRLYLFTRKAEFYRAVNKPKRLLTNHSSVTWQFELNWKIEIGGAKIDMKNRFET